MARPAFTDEELSEKREAILDAAMELFEAQGLEGISLRRIAARVGCSYTTPYRYFTDKQAVLNALRVRSYRWIEDTLNAAVAEHDRPIDALAALSRAYIEAALARPHAYGLLFNVGTGMDAVVSQEPTADEDTLAKAKRAALGVCANTIDAARDAGQLELEIDSLSAAHMLWAGAHGAITLHLSNQLVMGRSLEQIATPLVTAIITGMQNAQAN